MIPVQSSAGTAMHRAGVLAPYVGVTWIRRWRETADLARIAGEPAEEARWVAGLRFWF